MPLPLQMHAVVGDVEAGVANAVATELLADFSAQRLEPLFDNARHIDFQKQIGTALQIETEVDSRCGRWLRHHGGRASAECHR